MESAMPTYVAVLGVFLIIYLVVLLLALAYCVVAYIFSALGLFGVAKGLGIKNPWLAWIPYACNWTLGRVADESYEQETGRKSHYARWMLITMIATVASSLLSLPFSFLSMFLTTTETSQILILAVTALNVLVSAFIFIISITFTVFTYICCYRMFKLCCPDKAVLFLVLSILVSVVTPFFMFYCRNKVPSLESDVLAEASTDTADF